MKLYLNAICHGKILSLDKVNDPVFRDRMLGDGFAFLPENNELCAPCDGEVLFVYPTGHAVGLKTDAGIEILIHFGMGTYNRTNGKIKKHVIEGQYVKQGDILISYELDYFIENKMDIITPLVVTSGGQVVIQKENNSVKMGEKEVAYIEI